MPENPPPGPWRPPPPPGHTHVRPDTPPYPHTPQGPQAPYPGGPAGPPTPPQGWTPTPGPGGPSPRRNTGLVVTLCVVVALAVVAVTVLGVVLWRENDDDGNGRDTAGQSDEPGAESSEGEQPSGGTTTAPGLTPDAVPSSPTGPTESEAPPTPDPAPTDAAPEPAAFSYTEFGDDWRFRLGDVSLRADFVRGWDYDSCRPAEKNGALTRLGCLRASEWTYRALDGDLAMAQVVYTMRSEKAASRLIQRELIDEDSWQVKRASTLPGRAGSWRANTDGNFVVLTVETHESSVSTKQAQPFVDYGNADILGALRFRS